MFNPLSNKIYVFSDKLSEGNEEKAIFHENLHKALHDHYGDQVRQIAEEFWETSSPSHPESTKLNKERISEEYKDNPEEAKEEYFVRLAAHQMTEGNIDELYDRLSDEGKSIFDDILNKMGYDRTREKEERRGRKGGESSSIHEEALGESSKRQLDGQLATRMRDNSSILEGASLLNARIMGDVSILLDELDKMQMPEQTKAKLKDIVESNLNSKPFENIQALQNAVLEDAMITNQTEAPEVQVVYDTVKSEIPAYNFYDFEVTLNMIKSDNCNKLKKWFPEATDKELLDKLVEETINYLDDADNPYGTEKVWRYLNG